LGKETIDLNSYGKSSGRNGNYSTNYQCAGRELLTPDEVRMMDNQNALLFIRGERPVMDQKIDIKQHPNISRTQDGGASPYQHGQISVPTTSLKVTSVVRQTDPMEEPQKENNDLLLLSEEDLEDFLQMEETKHEPYQE
jgi:type IV secretion system protein VirD4